MEEDKREVVPEGIGEQTNSENGSSAITYGIPLETTQNKNKRARTQVSLNRTARKNRNIQSVVVANTNQTRRRNTLATLPLRSSTVEASKKYPVQVKQTLTNGDCFYSAIYRAAQERPGILEKLNKCLGLSIDSENTFISDFRNKVADYLITANRLKDFYETLITTAGTNSNSYAALQFDLPDWFTEEFGEFGTKLGTEDSFISRFSSHVKKNGEWVGEPEVISTMKMLLPCEIGLDVHKQIIKDLSLNKNGIHILHLYNPSERHFEYFSFKVDMDIDRINREKTLPTVLKEHQMNSTASEEGGIIDENVCITLYDPCSREPLSSMYELEKRIREIKKLQSKVPVGLYGITSASTIYDFLLNVFSNQSISLDDMVSFKLSEGASTGSDIYEVLCRLFVFFGGIEDVNPREGGNYKFMKKIEGQSHIYNTSVDALRSMKCKATRESGISDITLVRVKENKKIVKPDDPYCEVQCDVPETQDIQTFLMSVKWYSREKNAEHYDLEKLFTAAEKLTTPEQQPLGIIVFLKSKADFEIAHNRAYRQYVRDLAKTFFGWNEDVKPFLENIRKSIFELANIKQISTAEAITSQYFSTYSKPILSLQLHQDIIVSGLSDRLESSDDNKYLIGVLPRGGKTFIAGGIIREYMRRHGNQNLNIFWLTAAPGETLSQVRNELIDKFQDFDTFEFYEVKETDTLIKTKQNSIYFCSTQLLVNPQQKRLMTSTDSTRRYYLKDLMSAKNMLSMLFFDEAHKTGTGIETKKAINELLTQYKTYNLPFIFLTATYYTILHEYVIQPQNVFIWDYTDILTTRGLATETDKDEALGNLEIRFGKELVRNVIEKRLRNGESLATMAKSYVEFPELYFISADFQVEALERFAEQSMYNPNAGFSLKSIFGIKHNARLQDVFTVNKKVRKDAYRVFDNIQNPKNMISLITPYSLFAEREVLSIPGGEPLIKEEGSIIEPSILGRINKLSSEQKSRFRLDERPTMLMFMPTGGAGTDIFKLLCAWASLLLSNSWWAKNYEIACVVSTPTLTTDSVRELSSVPREGLDGVHFISKNTKSSILELERRLQCGKEKGLLLLAGEMLSLGISLPCTDVVFLFNEKKSPDDIIQKMYRALTPSPGKKSAYVVDLNPQRSLAALYGYTKESHKEANSPSAILDIIYDNYYWDDDIFNYNLQKGSSGRPLKMQDRIRELFEKADAEKTMTLKTAINRDVVEKKLGEDIEKKLTKEFVVTLSSTFSSTKMKDSLEKMGIKDISNVQLKNGKLIVKKSRSRPSKSNIKDNNSQNREEIYVIENYIDTIVDFLKYLGISSKYSTLEEALNEYSINILNQEGSSLRQNVLRLIRARSAIQEGSDKNLLSSLLLAGIKDFAFTSSESVFRDMKGHLDKPSARKNKILQIIHKRLTPRKTQRESKGEVFTPIELVEDMLSKLPSSVWSDPTLKWLDPANGIGNFPVVAYYKLSEGLKNWEPNEQKRAKHIIENMLYMIEFQSNNSRIARRIFESLCTNCKPNILTGDTLQYDSSKLIAKGFPGSFDVIMGNPPYNLGGITKGGGAAWPKFVYKAFDLIKENGYICFIHPPGWRKYYNKDDRDNQGKIWFLIQQKGWALDYLNVSDKPPAHFPIVDYYIIHAHKKYLQTKYNSLFMGISNAGQQKLDMPFIPNMINTETISIIHKLFKAKGTDINIVYNQEFKPKASDEYASGVSHYHFTSKDGKKHYAFKQYKKVPEYISLKKIILTYNGGYEKGKLFAFYSDEELGTTNNTMYMIVDSAKQGHDLVNFFNSDIITFLLKITQYSASPRHKNEFKILNQLKMPKSMTEYNLSTSEQKLINDVLKIPDEIDKKGGSMFNYTRKKRRT